MAGDPSARGNHGNHSVESGQPRTPTGAVRRWDAASGRPIPLQLDGPSDKVAAAALSPDGTRLAASIGDHTIRLWDLATGGLVTLEGPADHVAYGVRLQAPTASIALVSFLSPRVGDAHSPHSMRILPDASSRNSIM